MLEAIVTVHVIVCFALCIIILLQQGKGADIGAVFGGSSQTQFGTSSAGTPLSRSTWVLAAIFFATSIFLAYTSTQRVTGSMMSSHMPAKTAPARAAAPALPAAPAPAAPAAPSK